MQGLQPPYRVLAIAAQAGLGSTRQRHIEPIVTLVVMQLDHSDLQAIVTAQAIPDANFGQQPGDESQVALTVLHDLCTFGILTRQVEDKMLPFEQMTTAQDALDNLRNRLVLVDAVLLAPPKQRNAWLQSHFVAGLVAGT
ncbi:hypothetical protein D3C80_1689190 [compost metagenome]